MTTLSPRFRTMSSLITALVWFFATLMGFFFPATDTTLGAVQRLFYIHLGTYYTAFWLFGAGVLSGAAYLRTKHTRWDIWGRSCIEVGLWFLSITIVTGMFVARPVWGVYWTWDPRLTSVAIMWLTYLAYFFLRGALDDSDMQRRFAAVYAMVAFLAVIMSMMTLRLTNNLTAPVLDFSTLSLGMSPRVGLTLWGNIGAYSLVGSMLAWHLTRLAWRRFILRQRQMALLSRL